MYEHYFSAIKDGDDPRKVLIDLRKQIKLDIKTGARKILTDEQAGILAALMGHEDPKTRKNAVLILGEAACTKAAKQVYEAYKAEQTLFVRSSYLQTLRNLDYRPFLGDLKKRADELAVMDIRPEDKKHYDEERRILSEMIFALEKPVKHPFKGWHKESDVLLVVSPGMEEALIAMLPENERQSASAFRGAVRVQTSRLETLTDLRLYKQMLFRFQAAHAQAGDWQQAADSLLASGLVSFLKDRHEGEAPFRFRVDFRSGQDAEEKGRFIRRFAGALETGSAGGLVHAPSHYECEIRVIEDKKDQCHFYVRLTTIPDRRFAYRKYALPTSMHPVRAAEVVTCVKPWLAMEADVIDPFCGTGTLMIERAKAMPVRKLYGVDLYGDAIRYARENAALAGVRADFIQRDVRDFKSRFQFDEILTQLPAQSEHQSAAVIDMICSHFIMRIPELLKPGKPVIVCEAQPQRFARLAEKSGWLRQEAAFPLSGKQGEMIMVFTFNYLL